MKIEAGLSMRLTGGEGKRKEGESLQYMYMKYLKNFLGFILYLFILWGIQVTCCMHGGLKVTLRSQFSPAMWVPWIELRTSELCLCYPSTRTIVLYCAQYLISEDWELDSGPQTFKASTLLTGLFFKSQFLLILTQNSALAASTFLHWAFSPAPL